MPIKEKKQLLATAVKAAHAVGDLMRRNLMVVKKINEATPEKTHSGLNKITAWLKAIKTGDKKYIKSDFLEALSRQSLVDGAIKSQKNNNITSITW